MDLFLTDIILDIIMCSNKHNDSFGGKANHSLAKLADVDHILCKVIRMKNILRLPMLILVFVCKWPKVAT